MDKNGGEWGEIGGISGIAHGMWVVEGCRGMWLRRMEKTGRKMGETWDEIPIFHSPFFPFPGGQRCSSQFPV